MAKRVLILSELFEPQNTVGAIRPGKLAKYLHQNGYSVTVFCAAENLRGAGAPERPYPVIYAGSAPTPVPVSGGKAKGTALQDPSWKRDLKMLKRQLAALKKGRAFADLLRQAVEDGTLVPDQFDCVFSTFGPVGSVLAARAFHRMAPQVRWVQDFRDPMVSQIMPKLMKPYYGFLQRSAVRHADGITTVSEGYARRIAPKGQVRVIPNGFDRADCPAAEAEDGRFSFAYVGALYEGKRDLGLLFQVCADLIQKGFLPREQVRFHYAGAEGACFASQAARFGLEDLAEDHGMVSRAESIRIQARVRFLLLSTWNDPGEEGVFPGKMLEYMLMEKPIVSIVGGTLPGSEVTQIIRRMGLGVSCECADPEAASELTAWLTMQAERYAAGEEALYAADRDAVAREFDWAHTIERFCEVIDG